MESLYLLIPLSALLVLGILAVFGWALHRGQFEDLEREGQRILEPDPLDPLVPAVRAAAVDNDQGRAAGRPEESLHP